jgi:hypothetical protein
VDRLNQEIPTINRFFESVRNNHQFAGIINTTDAPMASGGKLAGAEHPHLSSTTAKRRFLNLYRFQNQPPSGLEFRPQYQAAQV